MRKISITTAVLFDLDETLLDRTNALIAFLADQHARFAGRLGDAPLEVWRDRFLARDGRGHIHKSVVYPAILAEFGGDADAAQALLGDYLENCCRHARGFPGMAETLTALRGRGLKLGIVTNGETAFQTRHIDALGLDALVDCVLISQTEGLRKPDAALFRRAAERLGVAPEDCLFVGDNPVADILGAHAAGMRTLWFRNGQIWPRDIDVLPGASVETLAQVLDWVSK